MKTKKNERIPKLSFWATLAFITIIIIIIIIICICILGAHLGVGLRIFHSFSYRDYSELITKNYDFTHTHTIREKVSLFSGDFEGATSLENYNK